MSDTRSNFFSDSTARCPERIARPISAYFGKVLEVRPGNVRLTHVLGSDRAVADIQQDAGGTQIYYPYLDQVNSASIVANANAQIVQEFEYRPYGETASQTGTSPLRRKFTSQEEDSVTNLYNYGARHYDPKTGTFTAADPALLDIAKSDRRLNPQKLNPYSYTLNNPIKYVDPDGKDAVAIVFPDYRIRVGDDRIGNLGHAGVLLIDNATGLTKYYEFGRYHNEMLGRVREIGQIPNVDIGKNGFPTADSLARTLDVISDRAGHGERIEGAYIENDNFKAMNDFAQKREGMNNDPNRKPYSICFNNCGDFVQDVIEAGDVDTPMMFDPRPNSYILELRNNFIPLDYNQKENNQLLFTPFPDY